MKKLFLFVLLIISSLFLYSQNNGQFFENSVIRIEYMGYSDTYHLFQVTNKVDCENKIKVNRDNQFEDYIVPPNSSIVIKFYAISASTIVRFKVKREGGPTCGSNPDNGWVELQSGDVTLSLSDNIKIISYSKTKNNKIKIVFKVLDNKNIKEFRIKTSKNGNNFKVIKIVPVKNTNYYEIYL